MARNAKLLSPKALDAAIAAALRAGGKKLIAVGGAPGLHLQVRESGQAWVYRYQAGLTADGRPWRRDVGMGPYPEVGLAEARERVLDLRRQQRTTGVDPLEHKWALAPRTRPQAAMTFEEASKRLIKAKAPEWKNAKHADQWRNTLATYAYPSIGRMPVDMVEKRHVEEVLAPIWTTIPETASRVRMRVEAVLDWATVGGYRKGDNPARWGGNLEHRLARPSKVKKKRNHPALPYGDMFRFMQALRKREGSARALEFAILTAARSNEVRGARWSEIDLASHTWTIPAERMKADREHVVPLSDAAIALLEAQPRLVGDLAFPAPAGGELSDGTLAKCIRLMDEADRAAGGPGFMDPKQGRVAVPHGFRSSFRDWAAECTSYPHQVAEMALAHTVADKTEAAYRRGDLLTKRSKMMADWAKYIDQAPAAGAVVPMRRKAYSSVFGVLTSTPGDPNSSRPVKGP